MMIKLTQVHWNSGKTQDVYVNTNNILHVEQGTDTTGKARSIIHMIGYDVRVVEEASYVAARINQETKR
jgi:hypothetical protein